MSNPGQRPTRNAKRELAREHARIAREKVQKQQKRRRLLTQLGVGIVVLALVAVVAIVIVNANHTANVAKASQTTSGPKNMLSDGILLTGSNSSITAVKTAAVKAKGKPVTTDESKYPGKANIVEYIDFQCPYCDQFETADGANIQKWVAAGKATVEIHPLSFLDAQSGSNRYSSRAANAAACVAQYDPNDFLKVVTNMYKNQPAENTGGMKDSKLVSIVAGGGASSSQIAACINGERFKSWVSAASARANVSVFGGTVDKNNISTPTVFVNGKQWNPSSATALTDPSQFTSFVESVVPGATR
ncbi:MAG TPA: thioredoxin domain-containing protein [Galbitalea sp.]